jgi:hypothetical protein
LQAIWLRVVAHDRVPQQLSIPPAAEDASTPSIAGNLKMPSQHSRTAVGQQPGRFGQLTAPESLKVIPDLVNNLVNPDFAQRESGCMFFGPSPAQSFVSPYHK